MDTLTIINDTVAVNFKGVTDVCQSSVESTGTNWCDVLIVLIICICVGIIAVRGISRYYNNKKEERDFLTKKNAGQDNDNKKEGTKNEDAKNEDAKNPSDNCDDITYNRELERQKRVLNLMQEICTLSQDPGSSKDVKGKFNDDAANKLWDLYQKIDSYHKSKVNSSTNISEQQNG